jgi:hypothetical protein
MLDHTRIAFIESRWRDNSNRSMRGMFDLIADIATGNPNGFHYEMAGDPVAMVAAIHRVSLNRKCRYLCIGAHGDFDGLQFEEDKLLRRARLRHALVRIEKTERTRLDGLYLSSCAFGSGNLAHFLFDEPSPITWIAGYREYVNWIDSSALDLLFFNELMRVEGGGLTPREKIVHVTERMCARAPSLVEELGFGVFVRKRGYSGGAENLVTVGNWLE